MSTKRSPTTRGPAEGPVARILYVIVKFIAIIDACFYLCDRLCIIYYVLCMFYVFCLSMAPVAKSEARGPVEGPVARAPAVEAESLM